MIKNYTMHDEAHAFRFCPRCGGALERKLLKSTEPERLVCAACEFEEMYKALMDTVIHTALFSGFCYTQFADTFQESNGLLTADRTPKIPLEDIAAATGGERNHIACGV